MQNNRLTTMNQWGDVLYIGPDKKGVYKGIGDYPENLNDIQIEIILKKLYAFEENLENLMEVINAK